MNSIAAVAIVNCHVEAAQNTDHELLTLNVSMCASVFAARNIIDVKRPLNIEWNIHTAFDRGKIALAVVNTRQIKDFTITNRRFAIAHTASISEVCEAVRDVIGYANLFHS